MEHFWENSFVFHFVNGEEWKNIAKGTTDPRVEIISQVITQIFIKIQLHNQNKTSTAKYCQKFGFKISPELQIRNLNQTLCSNSKQNLTF